jgi:hypothetical protein
MHGPAHIPGEGLWEDKDPPEGAEHRRKGLLEGRHCRKTSMACKHFLLG